MRLFSKRTYSFFAGPMFGSSRLVSQIPISPELSSFKEFEHIPQRLGKYVYSDQTANPKSVFLEQISSKTFSKSKRNLECVLAEYPEAVLQELTEKYNLSIVVYGLTGPDMWQGKYTNGFVLEDLDREKGRKSSRLLLPATQCANVKNAKVYFAERLIEVIDKRNSNEILGKTKDVQELRLKAVGFLANPKHNFYVDIDEILKDDTMHHVLSTTLKINENLGVHYIDMYTKASRYIEWRQKWRWLLGFGKHLSSSLEKHGVFQTGSWTKMIMDRWILILLGGGVSLGGITAILQKAKKKVDDSVTTAKGLVIGTNTANTANSATQDHD